MNITPIQTVYHGYKFRSRLEARWAVFLDHCGIKYVYEPEGFRLSNGDMYLPDFFLPEQNAYLEVKSVGAIKIEFRDNEVVFLDGRERASKYGQFTFDACKDGYGVIIVLGDPTDALSNNHGGIGEGHVFLNAYYSPDYPYALTAWKFVGFLDNKIALVDISDSVNFIPLATDYVCMLITQLDRDGNVANVDHIGIDPESAKAGFINIMGGMIESRQARFEHGEAGAK